MNDVEIDRNLIEAYRSAAADLVRAETVTKALRVIIESAMGDAEYATVDGEPVVRWATIKSRRLDMDKLRGLVDPVVLAECYVEGLQRRFLPLKAKSAEAES